MSKIDFSQPRRQSPKGLFLIFIQEGQKAIKAFWPVILPIFLARQSDHKWIFVGIFLLFGVFLIIVHSLLYYRKFRFHVEKDQFILNKGYINRKTLTIPIERIQNVNTNQTMLQQFLGVMSLEIDTAGTSSKELKINALKQNVAVELSLLLSSGIKAEAKSEESDAVPVITESLVMKLTARDLLRIGISENHIRTAVVLFLLGIQFFNQIKQYFKEQAEKYAHDAVEYVSHSGWLIVISLIIFFLLLSVLYSMIRTAVKFYDFRFYKREEAYRIVSGLFTKTNVLAPFRKIVQMNWETGPLKRLFGIYRVTMNQATGGAVSLSKLVQMPGCLESHLTLVKEDLFGPDLLSGQPVIHSSRHYFSRTWLYKGWLPALLATPLLFWDLRFLIIQPVWILLAFFYSRMTLKKSYFQVTNHQIRVSSGAVEHHFKQMEFHKVQHVEFRQSIFYKRRGIASLRIGNASGFITLPFIDEKIARALHDYLLYYAETSDRAWM